MRYEDRSYKVVWKRFSRWLTPVLRRKPKFLALLFAIVSPINHLHNRFIHFRNYVNYRIGITPQVVHLERLLNDRFDVEERRIKIVRGVAYDALPLYLKSEQKPQVFYKRSEQYHRVLYTKGETEIFTVDFIVKVPIEVPFDMDELTAYLDLDVLPSKVYKVQIV